MQSTPLEEDKLPIRIDEQVLVSDSFGFRLTGFSFRLTGFSFRLTGFSFRLMA